jgi:hypothetical protein
LPRRLVGFVLGSVVVLAAAAFNNGTRLLADAGYDCTIKGNISIDTGERIYHVPGQKYYDATRISPQYGERWFCSEAEARQAGWRKVRR